MPKEGITVESCIIGEWKKNVGDPVAVGDVLFTYETDKAEFECTSTAAGTLLAKFYEDGGKPFQPLRNQTKYVDLANDGF